jgi:hypothetical protein
LNAARISKWLGNRSGRRAVVLMAGVCVAVCFSAALARGQNRAARVRTSSIHWVDVPLGEGLERIASHSRAAIFLDRRVDPSKRITINTEDADLGATVRQASTAAGLGVAEIGELFYVGPTSSTKNLRTLTAMRGDDVAQLPAPLRAEWVAKQTVAWPRFVDPRQVVAGVVAGRGWKLLRAELIPHDLWRAGGLPSMTATEQLTVLLAGFELTFRLTPATRTVEILPIDSASTYVRRGYPLRYGAADAQRLRHQFPNLRMQVQGDKAVVEGRVEEHEELAQWLAGPQSRAAMRSPTGPSRQVYTLRVQEQSVRAIIDTLAERMDWQIQVDDTALRAVGLSMDKRVTFDVKNASQEELLEAILRPAGLAFRREGERIVIGPRARN